MTDRCGDPIFQLNSVLWMLQPLPSDVSGTLPVPVLHSYGYRVRALGKRLTSNPEIERLLATQLGLRGVPAPDLLVSAPSESPWPVFECKRSSFSSASTTAEQATKILARTSDISIVAGSPPGVTTTGTVVYVTGIDQASQLHATLEVLRTSLNTSGLRPASAATIGLRLESGVGLSAKIEGGDLPGAASRALKNRVIILPSAGDEEEPRSLYLIPFDPSVEQEDEERRYCLRVLLARGRASAASTVVNSPEMGTIVLEGNALLRDATYGLSVYWSDHSARDRAADRILKFTKSALLGMKLNAPHVSEGMSPRRLEVLTSSENQRQACADAIMALPLPEDPRLEDRIERELPFADA